MLRLDMAPSFWLGEHAGLNLDDLDNLGATGGSGSKRQRMFTKCWTGILRMILQLK